MFSYLITFHMNNGHVYKTVLIGKDLEDVKKKIDDKMQKKETFSHFIAHNNKSIHFIVIFENLSVIEIEPLSEEFVIEFEELNKLEEKDLAMVWEHVPNDFIIGIALLPFTQEFLSEVTHVLPARRQAIIKDIVRLEFGRIKMSDVLQAQNEVLQVISLLHEQGKIDIHFKEMPL